MGAGMTYPLEVAGGERLDYSCNCKGEGQHTAWRWRRARGQIMAATVKGSETTYSLEVEREGKKSDYSCNCKGHRDNIQPEGGGG
jgi:hypothetical protein